MATIHVPQVIESAEQAAALPIGTVAINGGLAACKSERYSWDCNGGYEETPNAWMVGWTALVPVEVEVEYIRESGARRREKTLYVTPWKDPR